MKTLEQLQSIFSDSEIGTKKVSDATVYSCATDTPDGLLKRGIINQETYDKLVLVAKQYERAGSEYRLKTA